MKKLINTKTIAIALCFVFVFLLGLTSLKKVEEVHASEGILKLSENEDGTFSVASGLRSLFSSSVSVKAETGEIYRETNRENYFLNVTPSTFLSVAKNVYVSSFPYETEEIDGKFFPETATQVIDFLQENSNTESTMTVYSPRMSAGYIGYAGRTYYQDYLVYSAITGPEIEVYNNAPGWMNHLASISEGIENLVMIAGVFVENTPVMLAASFMATLLNLSAEAAVYDNSTYVHKARLIEAKTVKDIYMVSDFTGGLHKFTEVQKTEYQYLDKFDIKAGFDSPINNDSYTIHYYKSSEYFGSAEQKAYEVMRTGVGQGYFYYDAILKYKYCGKVFYSLRF